MVEMNVITGLMFGFEYLEEGVADEDKHIIIDFFFLRTIFSW